MKSLSENSKHCTQLLRYYQSYYNTEYFPDFFLFLTFNIQKDRKGKIEPIQESLMYLTTCVDAYVVESYGTPQISGTKRIIVPIPPLSVHSEVHLLLLCRQTVKALYQQGTNV